MEDAIVSKGKTVTAFGTQVERLADLVPTLPPPLNMVGNTPLIRLHALERLVDRRVEIYGKAEWFNPGGSVKDRPALWMILEAKLTGKLTPDKTILEATSGNTGIAYAMIATVLGFKVKLVMPANVSEERKRILTAFGAEVVYTDPLRMIDGAIEYAHELYEREKGVYFMPDQYNNPANPLSHYETTAPEIIRDTNGRVTHFVAGLGTSGTMTGAGRRLKEFNPDIRLIAVQPDSPWHGIEGLKHMASAIVPGIYDPDYPDEHIFVHTEDAYDMMRWIARCGLLVGKSSGAALVAALQVAQRLKSDDAVIVVMLPDSGVRYLSTCVFECPQERYVCLERIKELAHLSAKLVGGEAQEIPTVSKECIQPE